MRAILPLLQALIHLCTCGVMCKFTSVLYYRNAVEKGTAVQAEWLFTDGAISGLLVDAGLQRRATAEAEADEACIYC